MLIRAASIGLAVGLLTLAGCPGPGAGPEPTPTPSPQPSVQVPAEAQQPVMAAKADLAKRKGVDETDIIVTELEAVDWPSTALGCPQPGMMYAQVITPGYRLVLAVGERTYRYHTDTGNTVVLCDD